MARRKDAKKGKTTTEAGTTGASAAAEEDTEKDAKEEGQTVMIVEPAPIVALYLVPIIIVAVVGLWLNGGRKLIRLVPTTECDDSRWVDMYGSVADEAEASDSILCCSSLSGVPLLWTSVCDAAHSRMTELYTTSFGAVMVPLLPFQFSIFAQIFFQGGLLEQHIYRLGLYGAVIIFRLGFLYLLLGWIQEAVQGEERTDCWYAGLRRSGTCKDNFDFADHIGLALGQIVPIIVFETFAMLLELKHRSWHQMACLCVSFGVALLVIGSLLDTTVYFHTRAENLMGIVLSLGTVWPLLFQLMRSRNVDYFTGGGQGALAERLRIQQEEAGQAAVAAAVQKVEAAVKEATAASAAAR